MSPLGQPPRTSVFFKMNFRGAFPTAFLACTPQVISQLAVMAVMSSAARTTLLFSYITLWSTAYGGKLRLHDMCVRQRLTSHLYIYRLWQALHLNQAKSIAGTITIFNQPPSRDARLDDPIQMNYLNMPTITNEEMMSTLDGEPLCYIYA